MRITTLRVLGACMCLGAALMLLSTFRMDKFLRSTLPGDTQTLSTNLIMHSP